MSDDLKARLRIADPVCEEHHTQNEAANRIEQLERENKNLRQIERNVQEAREHEFKRAENAFAKGFSAGQQALKDTGKLVVIDSPELAELREALTQSRAETAAAYERAARVAFTAATGSNACADDRKIISTAIRALATPDQNAALDAVKAEARAQGMREAAEIARCVFDSRPLLGRCFEWNDGYDDGTRAAKEAILAAIQKGEPK
jgi:replication fork clamp-binding protein CrfC